MKRYDFCKPEIGASEFALVREVLESNYLNEGSVTEEFEARLGRLVGSPHSIAASNCTSALSLCLMAAGIGPGDEVLVPDLTFIATAHAVLLAGARPVLVDVEAGRLTMCPEAAAAAITPRTKAMIPVHVSGRAADLKALGDLAASHSLFLLEDAAEALMSKSEGQFLGMIGHAGCISFSPNKTITTGQGGCILTKDADLARRIRELKDQGRPVRGTGGDDIHVSVGYNFRLTNIQAAVGLGQLELLPGRIIRAKRINDLYREILSGLMGFQTYEFREGEVPQWSDALVEDRDSLDAFLREKNIHGRKFWHPIHTQAAFRTGDENFPTSSRCARHAFWLPSAYSLQDEDIRHICAVIQEFYQKN